MTKPSTRLTVGIVVILIVLGAIAYSLQGRGSSSQVSSEAEEQLGGQAIDIMQHATKVETFEVTNARMAHGKASLVGECVILATGPVEPKQFADRLAGVFFDDGCYPASPAMRPMHPIFGARFISPKGTVELVTDPNDRHTHLIARNQYEDQFQDQWIEDIGDTNTLGKLINAAFPDLSIDIASGRVPSPAKFLAK